MNNAATTKIIADTFHLILRGFNEIEAANIEGLFVETALDDEQTEYLAGWNLVFLHDDRAGAKTIKIGYRRSDEEFGLCDVEIDQVAFDIECVFHRMPKAEVAA